jgi:type IV conjugative transfer system protein TraL
MSSNRNDILINTLDNSTRVLFWTVDSFALMVAPVFIGMILSSVLIMPIGFLLLPFYNRYKKNFPRGAMKHRMYWNLPHRAFLRFGKLKSFPASHERELIL